MLNLYENYFELRNWEANTSENHFWYYDELNRKLSIPQGAKVLEIGFGDGRFLDWCKCRKLKPVGVEILDQAIKKAQAQGHEVIIGPLTANSLPTTSQFDLIFIFDVIEHLTVLEILDLFKNTKQHLTEQGKYILRFPNGNSPFVGPTQTGDITHRTLVSPGTLEDIGKTCGLSIELVFNDRFLPAGIKSKIRRSVVYFLRNIIELIIGYAYFGRKIPLDPNVYVVLTHTEQLN